MNINDPIISKIESITNTVLTGWQKQQIANTFEFIQSDAIESTVRKCAEMIKHKCDQWPCFDSEYCRSRTDAVNEILSLIPQKEKKV